MSQIAILGCGPAGLLAAHAARLLDKEFDVISVKRKSVISGAQYLHAPILGMTSEEPEAEITYIKQGTAEGYAAKVYGAPDAPTSWSKFEEGEQPAWSLDKLYNGLWSKYSFEIIDSTVVPDDVDEILRNYRMVISTVPAQTICVNRDHLFHSAQVYIVEHCWRELPDNTILYSGDKSDHWYRTSKLFGHESTESTTPMIGARHGTKPTHTNCDCHSGLVRAGRFGKWDKGVLVQHAYDDAIDAIVAGVGRGSGAVL